MYNMYNMHKLYIYIYIQYIMALTSSLRCAPPEFRKTGDLSALQRARQQCTDVCVGGPGNFHWNFMVTLW